MTGDRRRSRPPHTTVLVGLAILGLVIAACANDPLRTASPIASVALVPSSPASALPTQRASVDRIRIGLVSPFLRIGDRIGTSPFPLSNVIDHRSDMESMPVARLLFRALYTYDGVLTPVPDLVTEPCATSADLLKVTCAIGAARFSDGSPLTAEDVAFTFDLAKTDSCPFGRYSGFCLKDMLASVEVVDPGTVRFRLVRVDPTFISVILPTLWVDSRRIVDAQYRTFRGTASKVGAARLRSTAETLESGLKAAAPKCEALRRIAEPLVRSAGIELPDMALWNVGPARSFDLCRWTSLLRDTLFTAADSLDGTGLDAEAVAYEILPLNWHPIGAGYWRIDEASSRLGERLVLVASPTAAHQPATARFEFISYPTRRDAAEGLNRGEIDWLHIPPDWGGGVEQGGADLYHVVQAFPDVKFAEYADPTGFMELGFNIRGGRLFSDPALRHAVTLCMNKRELVDAASDGQGTAATTVVASDFWPANPTLSIPTRDVAAARSLIEASGWILLDGLFRKGGKALAADLWVAEERPERVKFASLLAFQARDCGMDIRVRSAEGQKVSDAIYLWPHVPPGGKQPFDLAMAFGFGPLDPDTYLTYYETQNLSSAQEPYGDYTGFHDPAFDELIDQARQTYDIAKRARLYRDAQGILADQLPVLPIWYRIDRIALRSGLTSTSGALDLGKPGWDWRLDELVIAAPVQ